MTNSISTLIPTSAPDVYATAEALPLAKRFLSCHHATKLLETDRFIKPILIYTQNIASAKTVIDQSDTPSLARIFIPEQNLQTIKSLRSLAFEIFNAQKTSHKTSYKVHEQAGLGKMAMDQFARLIEKHETAATHDHIKLLKQCGNHWSMSPEELKGYTQIENDLIEVYLFLQEIVCHTDHYRKEWIRLYQNTYCANYPADDRSCKTNPADFCSIHVYKRMSGSEQGEFIKNRTCKLFPHAHESVKNDPYYRGIVQDRCPEAMEKSKKQDHEEL